MLMASIPRFDKDEENDEKKDTKLPNEIESLSEILQMQQVRNVLQVRDGPGLMVKIKYQ